MGQKGRGDGRTKTPQAVILAFEPACRVDLGVWKPKGGTTPLAHQCYEDYSHTIYGM